MNKGIGFDRTIRSSWLDAAAAFRLETDDPKLLRARLDPIVAEQVAGAEARRKTIDILLVLWLRSRERFPDLFDTALQTFATTAVLSDRLWLHYGLALLCYPFFRDSVVAIGQVSRLETTLTRRSIKERLLAERGHLGALERSAERVLASLVDWGVLSHRVQEHVYVPQRKELAASEPALEAWMVAAALTAHAAHELPFADLARLPELFPFRVTLTVDDVRRSPRFEVHRQGSGWEMVGLKAQEQ